MLFSLTSILITFSAREQYLIYFTEYFTEYLIELFPHTCNTVVTNYIKYCLKNIFKVLILSLPQC